MSLRLAGCVLVNDNKILLLHRNREGITQWELPGGKVDEGEDEQQTAVREIREELGVEVEIIHHLGSTTFDENGTEHIYNWYLAKVILGKPSICEPETFDNMQYFDVSELTSIKLSNNMKKLHEAMKTEVVKIS